MGIKDHTAKDLLRQQRIVVCSEESAVNAATASDVVLLDLNELVFGTELCRIAASSRNNIAQFKTLVAEQVFGRYLSSPNLSVLWVYCDNNDSRLVATIKEEEHQRRDRSNNNNNSNAASSSTAQQQPAVDLRRWDQCLADRRTRSAVVRLIVDAAIEMTAPVGKTIAVCAAAANNNFHFAGAQQPLYQTAAEPYRRVVLHEADVSVLAILRIELALIRMRRQVMQPPPPQQQQQPQQQQRQQQQPHQQSLPPLQDLPQGLDQLAFFATTSTAQLQELQNHLLDQQLQLTNLSRGSDMSQLPLLNQSLNQINYNVNHLAAHHQVRARESAQNRQHLLDIVAAASPTQLQPQQRQRQQGQQRPENPIRLSVVSCDADMWSILGFFFLSLSPAEAAGLTCEIVLNYNPTVGAVELFKCQKYHDILSKSINHTAFLVLVGNDFVPRMRLISYGKLIDAAAMAPPLAYVERRSGVLALSIRNCAALIFFIVGLRSLTRLGNTSASFRDVVSSGFRMLTLTNNLDKQQALAVPTSSFVAHQQQQRLQHQQQQQRQQQRQQRQQHLPVEADWLMTVLHRAAFVFEYWQGLHSNVSEQQQQQQQQQQQLPPVGWRPGDSTCGIDHRTVIGSVDDFLRSLPHANVNNGSSNTSNDDNMVIDADDDALDAPPNGNDDDDREEQFAALKEAMRKALEHTDSHNYLDVRQQLHELLDQMSRLVGVQSTVPSNYSPLRKKGPNPHQVARN